MAIQNALKMYFCRFLIGIVHSETNTFVVSLGNEQKKKLKKKTIQTFTDKLIKKEEEEKKNTNQYYGCAHTNNKLLGHARP